jgi:hypothetical protein
LARASFSALKRGFKGKIRWLKLGTENQFMELDYIRKYPCRSLRSGIISVLKRNEKMHIFARLRSGFSETWQCRQLTLP